MFKIYKEKYSLSEFEFDINHKNNGGRNSILRLLNGVCYQQALRDKNDLIIYVCTGMFTGIAVPKEDMELIKQRFKWAKALYKEQYGKKKSKK